MYKPNYKSYSRWYTLNGADFLNEDNTRTEILSSTGKLSNTVLNNDVFLEKTVVLTATNIKAMYTTAVDVIAAPGAGKAIIIDECRYFLDSSGTDYANGGVVTLAYTDKAGDACTGEIAAISVTASADTYDMVKGVAVAPVENAVVCVLNATAAFITGTSPVTLQIKYRIVTL